MHKHNQKYSLEELLNSIDENYILFNSNSSPSVEIKDSFKDEKDIDDLSDEYPDFEAENLPCLINYESNKSDEFLIHPGLSKNDINEEEKLIQQTNHLSSTSPYSDHTAKNNTK